MSDDGNVVRGVMFGMLFAVPFYVMLWLALAMF